MNALRKLLAGWDWLENATLLALALFLVAVSVVQIVLRNVFDSGLLWADPALRLSVLWIALVGGMVAAREQRHIAMDLLPKSLNPLGRRFAVVFSTLTTTLICGLAAFHGGRMVILDYQDGATAFLTFPVWVGELIIPLALGVIALRYFADFIHCLRGQPCT